MNKEFCTYEQALALKELGFDEPCLLVYHQKKLVGVTNHEASGFILPLISNKKLGSLTCTAPLYQQAFRWFREKYGLFGTVDKKDGIRFYKVVDENENLMGVDTSFKTYEEAEHDCLDKLIEICKTK